MKNQTPARALEATILVVELTQRCDHRGWHWDVFVHGAGKNSSSVQRTWHARGRLPKDSCDDLAGYVRQVVTGALVAWGGTDSESQM